MTCVLKYISLRAAPPAPSLFGGGTQSPAYFQPVCCSYWFHSLTALLLYYIFEVRLIQQERPPVILLFRLLWTCLASAEILSESQGFLYILHNRFRNYLTHYYTPFPGHASIAVL